MVKARRFAMVTCVLASGCAAVAGLRDYREEATSAPDGALDGSLDGSDAFATADADAGKPACDLEKPFGPLVPVKAVNSQRRDGIARLTDDELAMYLGSQRDASVPSSELYVATREKRDGSFDEPREVAGVNTTNAEYGPSVTGDGKTLYFTSDRLAPELHRIFVVSRPNPSVQFGPAALVAGINEDGDASFGPFVTSDGSRIYYSVAYDNGGGGRTTKVFVATRLGDGGFGTPAQVAGFGTDLTDTSPVLSADEKTIWFSSARAPSILQDVWLATRASKDGAFGTPQRVPELSTAGDDFPNWISPDGCRIYLHITPDAGTDEDVWVAEKPPLE